MYFVSIVDSVWLTKSMECLYWSGRSTWLQFPWKPWTLRYKKNLIKIKYHKGVHSRIYYLTMLKSKEIPSTSLLMWITLCPLKLLVLISFVLESFLSIFPLFEGFESFGEDMTKRVLFFSELLAKSTRWRLIVWIRGRRFEVAVSAAILGSIELIIEKASVKSVVALSFSNRKDKRINEN